MRFLNIFASAEAKAFFFLVFSFQKHTTCRDDVLKLVEYFYIYIYIVFF